MALSYFSRAPILGWRGLLGTALLACIGSVSADNHALILGVRYGSEAAIPGIELDVGHAREIARYWGVDDGKMEHLPGDISEKAFIERLKQYGGRLGSGDALFVYFSGHGARAENPGSSSLRCREGLVFSNQNILWSQDIDLALIGLARKGVRVVFMMDACHSGGVANSRSTRGNRLVAKSYPLSPKNAGAPCSVVSNRRAAIDQEGVRGEDVRDLVTLIAAAQEDEWAWASEQGSLATTGWLECLRNGGRMSLQGLPACVQRHVDQGSSANLQKSHHIQILGPLDTFLHQSVPAAQQGYPADTKPAALARPESLHLVKAAIQAMSSAPPQVRVHAHADGMINIGAPLVLEIETDRPGYLYVLYLEPAGNRRALLFPNDADANNRVTAGQRFKLPRPSWQLEMTGPPGAIEIMALVTRKPLAENGLRRLLHDPPPQPLRNKTRATVNENLLPEIRGGADVVTLQVVKP